jgi:hypothetical protein
MKSEADLRALVRRYANTGERAYDDAAADVAVSVFRVFWVAHRVWLIDTVDREFAEDVTKAIVDLSFALSLNPFWQANASYLQPILSNSVIAWTQSASYLDRAMNPRNAQDSEAVANDRLQALVTQSAFLEIIMAVMSRAAPDFFDKQIEIRDALTDFKERHLFEE